MSSSTTILTTCAEVAQGFRRTKSLHNTVDARVFYLNTVRVLLFEFHFCRIYSSPSSPYLVYLILLQNF